MKRKYFVLLLVMICAMMLCACQSNGNVNIGDKVSASYNGATVRWIKGDGVTATASSDDNYGQIRMSTDEGDYVVIFLDNNVAWDGVPITLGGVTYNGGIDISDGVAQLNLKVSDAVIMSVQIYNDVDENASNASVEVTVEGQTLTFDMQEAIDVWYDIYYEYSED